MARQRSPNRDKAFEIYKENNGNIENRQISKILNENEKKIAVWKQRDKWIDKINVVQQINESCTTKQKTRGNTDKKRKKGGNPNPSCKFPKRNRCSEKHGFFSKYLPEDTFELIKEIEQKDKLEILWENITIQYAAIIRSQRIMFVESKEEMIKELKKSKVKTKDRSTGKTSTNESEEEYEYEFQFAWDRQATLLQAQSRAMTELRSMIKQYDEILHNNWDMATEEQKLRIEKIRVEIEKTNRDNLEADIEYVVCEGEDYKD